VDGDARSGQLEPRPYSNRPNLLRHTLRSSMIAPVCSPECGGQSPGVVRQPKVRALVNLTRTLCRRVPTSRNRAQTGGQWRDLHPLEASVFTAAHVFAN
jgi:hypothetical protein